MTTLLRNIVADLVEKKLWPLAALLVVALVAVPVVLRGGEGPAPAVATPAAPPEGEDDTSPVTEAEEVGVSGVKHEAHDPFRRRGAPTTPGAPAPAGDPAGAAAAAGPGAATGSASSPSGSSGGASAAAGAPSAVASGAGGLGVGTSLADIDVVPVDDTTPAPAARSTRPDGATSGTTTPGPASGTSEDEEEADGRDSWHVDVRFGRPGALQDSKDVPRLSPLPGEQDPFLVFLGVQADGRTALFLLSGDARASGDGRCLPSAARCERVELRAGESERFDVLTPEGETVRYELELVGVTRRRASDSATASAARARESASGRRLLRSAVDTGRLVVSDLAYSRRLGLLVPSGRDQERRGALFGGYRVDLRFGAPDALVKRYNLARLTPLPSVEAPSLLFLGVLGDGATALFLNPQQAMARGDAQCEPSPLECERVTLRAGQSATFDAPMINGGTTEYRLDVDAITPIHATSEDAARASRHRESPAGRIILRRLVREIGSLVEDLTFAGGTGTLELAPSKNLPEAAGTPAEDAAAPAPDASPAPAGDGAPQPAE